MKHPMRLLMDQMAELHQAWDAPVAKVPALVLPKRERLRRRLLAEESGEADEAMGRGDISNIAKELVDVMVVTIGAALEYGIPLDRCWDEVLKSNHSKLGDDGKPVQHGKVTKGPNYEPPDMRRAVYGNMKGLTND